MSGDDYHRTLGIGEEVLEALDDHLETGAYEGLAYRYLPAHRRGVERGTALLAGIAVRGYPKVPRTLVLSTGVPTHFDGDVAVEEKLNGYNVRLVRVAGRLLAFLRGGQVCPFTTWLVERRFAGDFHALFAEHPEAMVCGEVVGPENPYTAHDYADVDSIAFRAFDWRHRETGDPLALEDRRARYEAFDVPQTPLLGVFGRDEAPEAIRELVCRLDDEGREGVVMKALAGGDQLKYTTSSANRGDLAYAFSLPFDYGRSFVFRRLLREGFQSIEFDETDAAARERARRLGEEILLSMTDAIETVGDGEALGERHTVRADADAIDALLAHLEAQGLTLEIDAEYREAGDRVLEFRKRAQSSTDRTRNYLAGQVVAE